MTTFDPAFLRQLLAAKAEPSECESLLLSHLDQHDVSIEVRAAPPTRHLIAIFRSRAESAQTRMVWKGMDQLVEGLRANQDVQLTVVSLRSTQFEFIAYVTSTAVVAVIARLGLSYQFVRVGPDDG